MSRAVTQPNLDIAVSNLSLELQSHLQGNEHWLLQRRSFQFVIDSQTLADQICGRAAIDSRMKFQVEQI